MARNGGRPGAFDGAFLLTRYRSEFAMTAIPRFVTRFVLPLQARIGRLLRRYDKFADAPAPVPGRAGAKLPRRSRPAPVAQLDRASVYGTEGQRFESSRAR